MLLPSDLGKRSECVLKKQWKTPKMNLGYQFLMIHSVKATYIQFVMRKTYYDILMILQVKSSCEERPFVDHFL